MSHPAPLFISCLAPFSFFLIFPPLFLAISRFPFLPFSPYFPPTFMKLTSSAYEVNFIRERMLQAF